MPSGNRESEEAFLFSGFPSSKRSLKQNEQICRCSSVFSRPQQTQTLGNTILLKPCAICRKLLINNLFISKICCLHQSLQRILFSAKNFWQPLYLFRLYGE